MNEKIILRTKAEFYDENWRKVEFILTNRYVKIGNNTIQFKEIEDIELVNIDERKAIRIKKGKDFIVSLPKDLQDHVFKYIVFNLKSDRFAVYFLSPAIVGGVVVKDAKWEKGYLSITDEALWFLSPSKQVRIPLKSLGSVERDIRTVGKKERSVLMLKHVESGEVITSFILCPETTLEMLQDYLRRLIEKHKPKEKLSEVEEQIIVMLYSGLDSASIESTLGITTEELNMYFDKLINLGLARVVKIRKELELTPKGISLVDDIMKKK